MVRSTGEVVHPSFTTWQKYGRRCCTMLNWRQLMARRRLQGLNYCSFRTDVSSRAPISAFAFYYFTYSIYILCTTVIVRESPSLSPDKRFLKFVFVSINYLILCGPKDSARPMMDWFCSNLHKSCILDENKWTKIDYKHL